MEIMLSHLGVGMAYDALDGLDVHAQRLHLRHIGVAAAVRCEQADIARFFQRFAEHISEMGGVAGQAGLGAFPDELVGGIPQLDGTRANIQRHRNIPDSASSVPAAPVGWHGTAPARPHRSSHRGHPLSQRLWRLHRTSTCIPQFLVCAVTAGFAG